MLNFKTTLHHKPGLASLCEILTEELKKEGFGILTRIDFHEKMKEKLGETIAPVVILGACHPKTAFQAYQISTDVTALMPCNAVIREIGPAHYSVELAKPSAMLAALPVTPELTAMGCEMDEKMTQVIARLRAIH